MLRLFQNYFSWPIYSNKIFQILKEGDFTEIHAQLGKEVLPEEYGGTNGKLQDHLGISL